MTEGQESNLRKIAEHLKRLPICHACVVEGQQHDCQSISAHWAGREILRTLDRDDWTTNALTNNAGLASFGEIDT